MPARDDPHRVLAPCGERAPGHVDEILAVGGDDRFGQFPEPADVVADGAGMHGVRIRSGCHSTGTVALDELPDMTVVGTDQDRREVGQFNVGAVLVRRRGCGIPGRWLCA